MIPLQVINNLRELKKTVVLKIYNLSKKKYHRNHKS